jgi:3-isopropylmalate/(R)-2-methylmalate dehydratase small subunit
VDPDRTARRGTPCRPAYRVIVDARTRKLDGKARRASSADAIIGTSFAGIFFDNCANNGLLAITIADADVARLSKLASDPTSKILTVDLPQQPIGALDKSRIPFDIEPGRKEALLLGFDAIDQTLKYRDAIQTFERQHLTENPWLA